MRHLLLATAAAAALAGCASTGSGPAPGTGNTTTRVISPISESSAEIILNPDITTVRTTLQAPPERAYAALQVAYADLGIPVTRSDPASFTAGNARFQASRRLGNELLSAFFDCGRALGGAPLADSYRVRINLNSAVVAAGAGSELHTEVTATALNPEGSSRDPVVCHSTGRLERHLANLVQMRLRS